MKVKFIAILDRWGWLLLLAASPFLLFPVPSRVWALLVVPLMFGARLASRSNHDRRTPLDLSILLLAVMVLVSLYATYDIAVSLPKIAGMVLGVGVFYETVMYCQRSLAHLKKGVGLFLLLGSGFAGVALLTTDWPRRLSLAVAILSRLPQRLFALPGAERGVQHNEVAGTMLWISPLAISLAAAWWAWGWKRKPAARGEWWSGVIATGAALLTTFVLILAQSRGGWLSFGVALLVLLVLSGGRARNVGLVGGGVALAALTALTWLIPAQMGEWIFGGVEQAAEVSSLENLAGRLEIWSRAIYAIQDFPLTGVGMNVFRQIVPVLYPLFLISPTFDIAHAHNTWLQAALDLGLPGLVAYLSMWIVVVAMLIQVLRSSPDWPLRMVAVGILSCLGGYFTYGITDTVALGARPGWLWWMLMALAAATWKLTQAGQPMPSAAGGMSV